MARNRSLDPGVATVFTIALPGIRMTPRQRTEALRGFGQVLRGEAVPGKRDSVCVGINIPPVSISYCADIKK